MRKGPSWLLNTVYQSYLSPRSSRSLRSAEQPEGCIKYLHYKSLSKYKVRCAAQKTETYSYAFIPIGRTLPGSLA